MAVEADLLGGGLDIDGWSYLKNEVASKIAEMTDRSLLLRSTFPLVLKYSSLYSVMELEVTKLVLWHLC